MAVPRRDASAGYGLIGMWAVRRGLLVRDASTRGEGELARRFAAAGVVLAWRGGGREAPRGTLHPRTTA
jgi:hypothetical protein